MIILRICACLLWLLIILSPVLAQDPPQCPMQAHNVEAAQAVVNVMGYDVTVKEGVIIGPQDETAQGTAICMFYASDKDDNWYGFAIKMKNKKVTDFKAGPVKAPKRKTNA